MEFEAKTGGWVGQDFSINITLSMRKIDMRLTSQRNDFVPKKGI